jgi:hypothetical protein
MTELKLEQDRVGRGKGRGRKEGKRREDGEERSWRERMHNRVGKGSSLWQGPEFLP